MPTDQSTDTGQGSRYLTAHACLLWRSGRTACLCHSSQPWDVLGIHTQVPLLLYSTSSQTGLTGLSCIAGTLASCQRMGWHWLMWSKRSMSRVQECMKVSASSSYSSSSSSSFSSSSSSFSSSSFSSSSFSFSSSSSSSSSQKVLLPTWTQGLISSLHNASGSWRSKDFSHRTS